MAFVTKVWKNRLVEFAGRRKLKNVATGEEIIFDVSRSEGAVSQAGDAFSDANMNNLEQRIKNQFDTLDSNLANQKKLLYATESYNANTQILLNDNITNFSTLIICFSINGRADTVFVGTDYLVNLKGVSYVFASADNSAIGSVYYIDSTHIFLANGLSKLQIFGLK